MFGNSSQTSQPGSVDGIDAQLAANFDRSVRLAIDPFELARERRRGESG